ncbi:ferredoxin--NADP reductase [Hymenobacter sp. BT491]|uniref:ferredoxin--NADP reductase n=1 Tax=Hymenobacter sp. BT491 TaxID=2766779 RepID=UPI0016535667|nr:ferredoxin--NADP reductase [Hymenobacter sp. BT491]MBC6988097.1 ferredoxin--NADP reductase [Hymenobacter sp. BT491]
MNDLYNKLTISKIKRELADVKAFYFEEPDARQIYYEPGQYLTFVLQTATQEIRRSYSIISAPVLGEPLAIGVKRIPNGAFSRYLIDQAQSGDQLLTIGAAGFFTLPPDIDAYQQVFFLAAGSGITPVFSLLKTVLYAHPTLRAVLIYSNRSREETIFHAELDQLAAEFPQRLRIEYLYSNNAVLAQARLHKDLLKSFIAKLGVAPREKTLAYLCGPTEYMRMGVYGLREADVPFENIKRENFSTDTLVIPKIQPPDTEIHTVTVHLRKQKLEFQVQYPNTILQAAKKHGINLPYSCETGRCGSCVARCTAGQVWMSYNEVLTEKDLAKKLVLTCVGYPINGDVWLEI